MSNRNENVVHRITNPDGILVEVDDLEHKATTPEPSVPEEVRPTQVEILSNGWVRCRNTSDPEGHKSEFNYYPPERINGVFAVEHKNSDVGEL